VTVHKCQGQSLTRAEMSLSRCFESGQAYVALSRVSSLAGVRLLQFDPRNVRASKEVVEYYAALERLAERSNEVNETAPSAAAAPENSNSTQNYRCERAPSGRAKCRGCQSLIRADVLRVGVMVHMNDRSFPLWCHAQQACVSGANFRDQPPLARTSQFGSDFLALTQDDQAFLLDEFTLECDSYNQVQRVRMGDRTQDEPEEDVLVDELLRYVRADTIDEENEMTLNSAPESPRRHGSKRTHEVVNLTGESSPVTKRQRATPTNVTWFPNANSQAGSDSAVVELDQSNSPGGFRVSRAERARRANAARPSSSTLALFAEFQTSNPGGKNEVIVLDESSLEASGT
jgi:hypothetical protein